MQDTIVGLHDVTKRFDDVTAVENLDLEVREGELLTLLGPSGCGKTTTLRMIAGFEEPTEGRITIDGADVSGVPPYERDIAIVFQHFALFPHMTVSDNVAFGLEMAGVPKAEIDERVSDVLEMVSLSEMGSRRPNQLSGGQQQRVALARALVTEPSVLLLDEPLSSLDKKLREEMRLEILRLHRELDVTMIYVTHNQDEALSMSDRMAVLADGRIQQVGSPDEVYQNPSNRFVADFIGTANLFSGTVADASNGHVSLQNGFKIDVDIADDADVASAEGNEVTVLFRPEFLSLTNGESDGMNNLPGVVRERTYYGSRVDYFVEIDATDDNEKVVQISEPLSADSDVAIGEEIVVSFDPSSPILIGEE